MIATPRHIAPIRDAERAALLDLWVASWRATFPTIDFDARRDWFVKHLAEQEAQGADLICMFQDAAKPGERKLVGFVLIEHATEADLFERYFAGRRDGFRPGVPGRLVTAEVAPRG